MAIQMSRLGPIEAVTVSQTRVVEEAVVLTMTKAV